ncbi:hypothetical protein LSP04_10040 [Levilactobacillus spicheri]|uniref:Transposase n=1 Tax=Levilactobacillus spicheri TaxID=216463 RepID=A0ABQ0WPX9_9LACO|nr:hypothetical protein LSP04_10040 [Levilactobacillus spicheri]
MQSILSWVVGSSGVGERRRQARLTVGERSDGATLGHPFSTRRWMVNGVGESLNDRKQKNARKKGQKNNVYQQVDVIFS